MVQLARPLSLDGWKRRAHFEFFSRYDLPFWNVCVEVDVEALHDLSATEGGPSFFLASTFLSLRAVNAVEELHFRIHDGLPVVYETIHGGSTVLMDDETFRFAYFDYLPCFADFSEAAQMELEQVRSGVVLEPRDDRDDLVHHSVLPWVPFTSFTHARRLGREDSVPKIVFGKHRPGADGRRRMPVSLEVHHALVDGLHVGRFFEAFEADLANPEAALRRGALGKGRTDECFQ